MKLVTAIVAVWLLACLPLHAAEQDSPENEDQQTVPETRDDAETETVQPLPDIGLIEEAREREQAGEGDEDFVPSIRITEDLPVAFPADI